MPHSTELAVNSARQIRKKALRPSIAARNALTVSAGAAPSRHWRLLGKIEEIRAAR
jgi:hypothetical protein